MLVDSGILSGMSIRIYTLEKSDKEEYMKTEILVSTADTLEGIF